MNIRTIAIVSSALVGALLLAGCAPAGPGTTGPTPNSVESAGAFNSADAMFATGMIPHHEQAVEMADMVLAKTGIDERVITLAQQIEASRLFLEQMIVHHEGAITMSQVEIDNGTNSAALALAGAIVTGQTAEVATMKDLLGKL